MITYFFGREEVTAYLRDFLDRLARFEPAPEVWCPLTESGTALLEAMLDLVRDVYPQLGKVVVVSAVADERTVRFVDKNAAELVRGKNVLIFDGAVHSGRLLTDCVTQVTEMGAQQVCTYSLVIKRGTKFVPTIWGITIEDVDRAFFLLDTIPNHRLDAGSPHGREPSKPAYVHMRALAEQDTGKPPVVSELESIDRVTWGDRYFDMKVGHNKRCCYLLEQGKNIVGFVTLSHSDDETMSIDEVAVDKAQKKKKFGAVLLRFSDTMARSYNCRTVKLQAVSTKVDLYKGFGFQPVGSEVLKLNSEEYLPMEKTVVYNRSWLL
jgi:predicted GNAT family N-acyltransferase